VDYYVSDRISTPPELQDQYTEKLMLLPDFYLCNDLFSSAPDFWLRKTPTHITRKQLNFSSRQVLLANFGQPHKITPEVFACWLRVLRRCPRATLWLFRFALRPAPYPLSALQ
jgi:protein O-GlcNAc transferase